MKNIKTLAILISCIILLFSCEGFLEEDTKGKLSPDGFFSTKNDLDLAITALFSQFQGLNGNPGRNLYSYSADDVTAKNAGNKTRFAEWDMFNYNSGNVELGDLYANLWRTVKACNYVINNAERTPADRDFINARLGQAYLVRAYCYFNLVRCWGPIPIVTDVTIDYDRPKAEVSAIYESIESDCLKAEEMLPVNHSIAPYFQNGINVSPGKGAAKALLASVYMTEAGWPLKKGASYYDKAAEKYKEIIDNEAAYGYILEPDIIDLTIETKGNYSKEIVWGSFHHEKQNGYMGPQTELPEETNGWCDLIVEIEFFNSMPEGPRKDAFILKDISLLSKKDPVTGLPTMVPWYSTETNTQHPHWRKNIDNGRWDYAVNDDGNVTYSNAGMNWIGGKTRFLFRYADILLLYSEAKAFGSSGPDALAYTCLNRVRERAGLAPLSGLSTPDFQQAALDERRWEVCGIEGGCMQRFFTMQRHEILHLQKNYRDADDLTLNAALTLSEDFYYFPIPDRETLIVPHLE